jgi:dTDP-4-amino-4,6-dideoxygalactose transaminase
MNKPIPFFDLMQQYAALKPEMDAAVARVLSKGHYILGEEVESFEKRFAALCGAQYGIGANSGTTALMLGLLAMGVGPGDEVVTVAHTFIATSEAISLIGATPVFVDVEGSRACMDPTKLEAAITPRTKAIIPVHIYGHPADMDGINAVAARHGVPVLEDACQAHGALYKGRPVGTLGQAACFSFYPSKNLGAYGEAGALVTNDAQIAEMARILRDHGSETKYQHSIIGLNGRMEAIQGAVLNVKLPRLASWNTRRRQLAKRYDGLLAGVRDCRPIGASANVESAYHLYVVRIPRRDAVRAALAQVGVGSQIHYPIPVHRQPAYTKTLSVTPDLPVTDTVAAEILSLPFYPEMDDENVDRVVEALDKALKTTA